MVLVSLDLVAAAAKVTSPVVALQAAWAPLPVAVKVAWASAANGTLQVVALKAAWALAWMMASA